MGGVNTPMERIYRIVSRYLSSKLIFLIDFLTAVLVSIIVLLSLNFFTDFDCYSGHFAIWWIAASAVLAVIAMVVFKTYHVVVRHTTIRDFSKYVLAILSAHVMLTVVLYFTTYFNTSIVLAILASLFLNLVFVSAVRFMAIMFFGYVKTKGKGNNQKQRVLIFGTADYAVAAGSRINNSKHYSVVGYISKKTEVKNLQLAGYPVLVCQNESDFLGIVEKTSPSAVLFVNEADVKSEESGVVKYCLGNNIKALIIPPLDEVIGGKFMKNSIRQVKIEDLLGRPEIKVSMQEIKANFQGKVVMVTGAAGSIGSELCRQLAGFGIKQLVLYDNAETPMHELRLELEARFPELDFVPVIGSVRHVDRLDYVFRKWTPQVVFHAAAYKHVPLMEENPCEAVFANVHGSRMVADKCVEYGTEMMVMISTDKAVNPTNIMGCSKRIAEIYVQSLGLALESGEVKGKTKFVTTRFGNVLGSNGSVIPHFREQIEHGGPVTVTHPEITRFFMTIPEACRLVMEAATLSTGNQIFVFDMGESVKIVDLARKMIELAGLKEGEDIHIEFTGLRPGEKLYEEVLADAENTNPTSHDRIRIAKVREYSYQEASRAVDELTRLSKAVDIPGMVKLMKAVVPEFISNNSRFEEYDTIQ